MNGERRVSLRPATAVVVALALLIAGAGVAFFLPRSAPVAPSPAAEAASSASTVATGAAGATHDGHAPAMTSMASAATADVEVPLSPDAVRRAGIVTAPVSVGTASAALRIPGIVEPNAYRQVAVTPLVSGRVTAVAVDLGDRVRRGQTLADVYSPELAEAQTRYISARAELQAHDRALQRAERLVEIGAASREELERIHAEHTAQTADVQTARTKLELLGVPASALDALAPGKEVDASTVVPAPMDGIVTERIANLGLNVDPSMKLFTVVDLSTVWVLADLYERDFATVRVGSTVTVTTGAYPDRLLHGRVSYIDPQVNRETRTARLRVEVPNPQGDLRLGMYADVIVGTERRREVAVVPRAAIQNVGSRTVVYLAKPAAAGTFVERDVVVGRVTPSDAEIEEGLAPGDVVVTDGSFFVRAELERLGLRPNLPTMDMSAPVRASVASSAAAQATRLQTAEVRVTMNGFEPARLTLKAGVPARVTFVRTTDQTCATAVVFPSMNVRHDLPLNQPVNVDFTPSAGELGFACGMNMFKGAIVVE